MEKQKSKKWVLRGEPLTPEQTETVATIASESGLSFLTARLLWQRGYKTSVEVRKYLQLEATSLHDPFLMTDMDKAVERILSAIERHEKITVYGDYDVDGVTATSLLYLYLKNLGGLVDFYIPHRVKEGYGLSVSALDTIRGRGTQLLVTVDNGITSVKEIDYAISLGMDVVVTDHHTCLEPLPNALAVVNPHRKNDAYPFPNLAGVGVAFKLACGCELTLCKRNGIPELDGLRKICRTYSDLVAVGTVADVMPVENENRLLIAMGLKRMESEPRQGISALMEASTPSGKELPRKITSTYISFTLSPRLNAAGRVDSPIKAMDLLLAQTREDAKAAADELCRLNALRQAEENQLAEEAIAKIEEFSPEERDGMLLPAGDHWLPGIIGIVASRMTERYGVPSILISFDGSVGKEPLGTDLGKGSGRSIPGVNLVEALASCQDLLERFGGHELAAGLSVRRSNLPELRRRLNDYAKQHLKPEDRTLTIEADFTVSMQDLTLENAMELSRLEPFGTANPVPSFVLENAELKKICPMGGGKHLRLVLEKDGIEVTAVRFGMSSDELPFVIGDKLDLLFQMNVNEYRGFSSLQLILQDCIFSGSASRKAEKLRFAQILQGASFCKKDNLLPNRDDFATVYTYLLREIKLGKKLFSYPRIMGRMQAIDQNISFLKLLTVLQVLNEMELLTIEEYGEEIIYAALPNEQKKVNLSDSALLNRLEKQLSEPLQSKGCENP